MALKEEFESQGNWLFKRRSFLPLLVLLAGVFLFIKSELYPQPSWIDNYPYEWYYEVFCLGVSLFGLAIRVYTVGHTPRHTSGRNVHGQLAEVLNTSGIYSLVRHPLYLGNFFMWLGPTLLIGQFWFVFAFCLAYWLYYERIMFAEEQFLQRKFGDAYDQWASNTPAFIPKFKKFNCPNRSFSWRKVLKSEKNGLLAIFIIFLFFDISEEVLERQKDYNWFLVYGTAFTVLLYATLKYLKRKTALLDEPNR